MRDELARLSTIPTSSSRQIHGRRVVRQLQFISVDNHTSQEEAEIEFRRQVSRVGGNGVINMAIRRHRGGYISIQGDAVKLGVIV